MNSWCTNGGSHSRVYNSGIDNPSVGDPRIKDASTNNSNGSRIKWGFEIQEHSKVQRTNETLKIEEPLKAQFESLNIYEKETFMYMRLLVKKKCINMVIKMSLRYWSIGRSPLMKMPITTTIPCGQSVLKGKEMRETPKYVL